MNALSGFIDESLSPVLSHLPISVPNLSNQCDWRIVIECLILGKEVRIVTLMATVIVLILICHNYILHYLKHGIVEHERLYLFQATPFD